MKTNNASLGSELVHLEIQPGSDTLVIAFTGIASEFNSIQPFDFFKLTGLFDYNRLLIREPWRFCYLKGIDSSGFDGLLERLRNEIQKIGAKKVVILGTSAGGYAALLFGHLLDVDYVHSFSPFTYYDLANIIRGGDYKNAVLQWPGTLFRLNFGIPRKQRRYLDLRPLLMNRKGKTRFYIHACARSSDRTRALHLENCPDTSIFLYPCATHNVTWGMIKTRCLREMLKKENFDDPAKIYHQFYPNFDPDNADCDNCKGAPAELAPKITD